MTDYEFTRAYDESRDRTDRHGTPDPQAVGDGGGEPGCVETTGTDAVFVDGELVVAQADGGTEQTKGGDSLGGGA